MTISKSNLKNSHYLKFLTRGVGILRIAVLCGGVSSEREVSLNSGAAVEAGLKLAGHDTERVDVKSIARLIRNWPELRADAAFIALHGGWGEDGRLQAALDAFDIPYTGSRPRACMTCMDKESSRGALASRGIPVPPGIALRPSDKCDFEKILDDWKKIVVKPASNGSTVGVSITEDAAGAADALNAVWDIDVKAIVEKFIPGRELTVTVFGSSDNAFALPVVEIRPHSGFYDYKSKYTEGESEYLCPAPIGEASALAVSECARRAHVILGCVTYSRVDLRFTGEGGDFFVLEVNTAPGMTATSLVPKAAAAHGWTFPQLLGEIVRDSFNHGAA
jgi:D-alanine-D-alanine ligase